ncbi:MAG TPA: type II secretion system protein [Xanthomonadaceae bacterium]|nr:type II secretion system protein [Xanthomonadaceae bacterium]
MPASARHRRQHGFTLIEVVAAFSILALGLGLAMRIATGAMAQASRGAAYTQAALNAKSVLDIAGVGERLEEGTVSGEFEDGSRWELDISQWEPEDAAPPPLEALAPVALYRLHLTVWFRHGGQERPARFTTLRALTPELGR